MTQLWLCPRTPSYSELFTPGKKSLLLQVLRTIHPALHNNSQAKLYQRENQKGLTDGCQHFSGQVSFVLTPFCRA